ncbi:restriction endonuclease subunit S [Vogesella indigofera]|uniref:restriction endonuclease subunit S n=1 Tax=Vogesella indigofera TaxID=45465 RepID=UPI00234F01D8|nr:restriction endonuclease subunit S [Vogesella indigofera]MDC7700301.1 restriction endonuclease subunit S [Vogesella indigofera]
MLCYESYKPSGLDWLGDIPSHWGLKKSKFLWREKEDRSLLGTEELLSVSQYSGVVPRAEDSRSESLEDYKRCKPNDLVINIMLAWMSGLGVSKYSGIVSPAYCVYRQLEDHNPWYFDYLYRTPLYLAEFARRSKGIVPSRWRMYTEDFGQILSLLPPREEQDRIVAFLDQKTDEIDAAIAKKERLIELLQEQKNIRIHKAVLRGLNPKVPLRDSGVTWIGAVPAHWKVIPNRFIFREQNARSLRGEEIHLSMSQRYGLVPAKELDVQTLQSESYDGAKLCQKGDLVQNRLKAHLAVFAVAPCDGLVSPDYSVFRLQKSESQPVYFERLFKTPNYLGEFNRRVRGIVVGFLRLYSEDFNAIPALVPSCDEQAEIVRFIETTNKDFEKIRAKIDAEIVMLRELKAITVASAVTGKIKV